MISTDQISPQIGSGGTKDLTVDGGVQESKESAPVQSPVANATAATPQNDLHLAGASAGNQQLAQQQLAQQQLAANLVPIPVISSVLIILALAEIVTTVIVIVTGSGRYASDGLIIGFFCLAASGRGLFGNFTLGGGPRSIWMMVGLSAAAVSVSIASTVAIFKSLRLADKEIHSARTCFKVGNSFNTCDALNVVYNYLQWSFYIALGCCIFSVLLLMSLVRLVRDIFICTFYHIARQANQSLSAQRNQAISDLESASLLNSNNGEIDEDNENNPDTNNGENSTTIVAIETVIVDQPPAPMNEKDGVSEEGIEMKVTRDSNV